MKTTTVRVVNQDEHDSGPFEFGATYTDGTLNKVIASLLAIRDSIPEQYREQARCQISSGSHYDSSYATIEIEYTRPETSEEMAAREERSNRAKALEDAKLREQYDKLKQRFG